MHWTTQLERDVVWPEGVSGPRVKQKHWILRMARTAYNRAEMDDLNACEECRVAYWRFSKDGLLRKLEVDMPGFFGL